MIPVALQLQNFMSYGTEASVLDFEQFQVACLSGRNGQGKSALLDAITWALWGEARKSSGPGKPDDELLRIGQRDMQVEFTFDVEGERYRVVRSYARSATGKTSKSNLELTVYEPESDNHRPLTGASMRETQEHIDRVVGLDYDTFINSAFLLQGRSDEFTKKSPKDRKVVLAKVLNLDRYDRLAELAGEREREAKRQVEQMDLEVARLNEALEPEPVWKQQLRDVEEQIRQQREALDALREDERRLAEQRSTYEATSREVESVRKGLGDLEERLAQHQEDMAALKERIRLAQQFISQRDDIQRDFDRYQRLQDERNELDSKNELFRGIEKQVERLERELHERKNELERQLDKVTLECKTHRDVLTQCEVQLKERIAIEMKLEKAQAAQRRWEELVEVRRKREAIKAEMDGLERTLHGHRQALISQLELLTSQVQREKAGLPNLKVLEADLATLQAQEAERAEVQQALEAVEVKGKDLAERLREQSALYSAREEDHQRLLDQRARLDDGIGADACPTCGSPLDAEHRAKVQEHYATAIAEVKQALAKLDGEIEQVKSERDALREQFKTLRSRAHAYETVPERLTRVKEQIRQATEVQQRLDEETARMEALRRQIEEKAYGEAERTQYVALKAELEKIAYDEAEAEQVQQQASQVERYKDDLRRLEEIAGRQEQVRLKLERAEKEADALRENLDQGTELRSLHERIGQMHKQLTAVGFDPARFREVKQALEALHAAPERMTKLVNAQQNHADWQERVAKTEEQVQGLDAERTERKARLADLEKQLLGRDELEAQYAAKGKQCAEVEQALHALQKQFGQMEQKLENARRDREALKSARAQRAASEKERSLYNKLRAAFGKHGIPSLIIEQTLPEIEDRANEMLERLTDGRMHVRLETLKDKKTGGTKETLEIRITDEQGVSRPYETFSGGEAFRVNFALRLALAQLLAERSGVRVRTLVVDEGFGTQDDQGVQNLVEAINLVQDDFDKIIVITHLKELKEAFPVRIDVEKDPVAGSRFEMHGV